MIAAVRKDAWPMHRTAILLSAAILVVAATPAPTATSEFADEMNAAMDSMMDAMQARATGDVDRDFATMMIPHHQGAIDMAVAELRYGTNPQLRRIAQEIIVDQQQEIAAMRLAIGDPLPPPEPVPTQPEAHERQKGH
ncbi:hypothetical protein MesoLj131c_16960 [Mesorhizobium sp. 131-3-5]|jgi:uncharacterized protein (DUF305 family)|uniref:DUF305 domain-containing protein n=2 Tax=unclassified Mesorhizobium TaxID=325217 RepID=UPI001925F628|nr:MULTISPECIES: DUF305 domain-containing protein [unclassified Mesorhizobium]BCG99759.1 hypothetical protein MesoLj131b_17590 [Mesorhizobium sp. 131-2-5]BCH07438.1 hypothetical protein MesoLj131c_16960 [Mesorhizobium sp. 131-3-5]